MFTTFEELPADKAIVRKASERGAALATALMLLAVMGTIAMTVLAVVHTEGRIAGSDLKRTQTFYAAAAGIEKMTSDFSALFVRTSRPTLAQLNTIANSPPTELTSEGFSFSTPPQTIALDQTTLDAMRATQGLNSTTYPRVTMPSGPFAGLIGSVAPYDLTSTATSTQDGTKVTLTRKMNNYLIPIFQFGMFSNNDIELNPGPQFTFNGRVHANGNIYTTGRVTFLAKVTTANELIYDVMRNGNTFNGTVAVNMTMMGSGINVPITMGSMNLGPNLTGALPGQRGYFPGSATGTFSSTWNSTTVAAAVSGTPNQLGGQLQTRTTGAVPLLLPLQLDGNPTREIVKRRMPNDDQTLSQSRYHTTASIRVLVDDETPSTTDASGIPAGQGVALSTFDPVPLPAGTTSSTPTVNGGGRALWQIYDNNTGFSNSYNETSSSFTLQQQNGAASRQADTVRGVRIPTAKNITGATNLSPITITCTGHGFTTGDIVWVSGVGGNTAANGESAITVINSNTFTLTGKTGNGGYTASTGTVYALPKSSNGTVIPTGSGLKGRILIQIVDSAGTTYDVTSKILSMGMTEGEPNSIVTLQRPLWAAFTQGSRDASGSTNYLTNIIANTKIGADGEILIDASHPSLDGTYSYMTSIADDGITRADVPPANAVSTLLSGTPGVNWSSWNAVVPLNVYNVREGMINSSTLTANAIYERGITSVVEINMKNLARWMDGVYDQNLLAGTNAVSTNIACPDGYTVYVSDRRGDKVKTMVDSSGATISSTNGMVDNEDFYGWNGSLDPGEDVQATGTLIKDTTEMPDPTSTWDSTPSFGTDRIKRAIAVAAWQNPTNYFRRAVRVFNGENLQVTGGTGKLSPTKGITVSAENLVYIWGNYNTTGINGQPTGESTLNDSSEPYWYLGNQVPTSIVCDAISPLSKTWFDAETSVSPDDLSKRLADLNNTGGVGWETSVRAGIIAGNNLAALAGQPDGGQWTAGNTTNDSRGNGGIHNFPRFLERWKNSAGTVQRWNFVGSLIPLYRSTQYMGPFNTSVIYDPPVRNWAFDSTFLDPNKLPPGTPQFQYIEPTAFRQVL